MTDSTLARYQAAIAALQENDQPTIAQHEAFIKEMLLCAEDYTEDRQAYLDMAESQKRIVKIKQEREVGK